MFSPSAKAKYVVTPAAENPNNVEDGNGLPAIDGEDELCQVTVNGEPFVAAWDSSMRGLVGYRPFHGRAASVSDDTALLLDVRSEIVEEQMIPLSLARTKLSEVVDELTSLQKQHLEVVEQLDAVCTESTSDVRRYYVDEMLKLKSVAEARISRLTRALATAERSLAVEQQEHAKSDAALRAQVIKLEASITASLNEERARSRANKDEFERDSEAKVARLVAEAVAEVQAERDAAVQAAARTEHERSMETRAEEAKLAEAQAILRQATAVEEARSAAIKQATEAAQEQRAAAEAREVELREEFDRSVEMAVRAARNEERAASDAAREDMKRELMAQHNSSLESALSELRNIHAREIQGGQIAAASAATAAAVATNKSQPEVVEELRAAHARELERVAASAVERKETAVANAVEIERRRHSVVLAELREHHAHEVKNAAAAAAGGSGGAIASAVDAALEAERTRHGVVIERMRSSHASELERVMAESAADAKRKFGDVAAASLRAAVQDEAAKHALEIRELKAEIIPLRPSESKMAAYPNPSSIHLATASTIVTDDKQSAVLDSRLKEQQKRIQSLEHVSELAVLRSSDGAEARQITASARGTAQAQSNVIAREDQRLAALSEAKALETKLSELKPLLVDAEEKRKTCKAEVRAWSDRFKEENGRAPVPADMKLVREKFVALKKAELRRNDLRKTFMDARTQRANALNLAKSLSMSPLATSGVSPPVDDEVDRLRRENKELRRTLNAAKGGPEDVKVGSVTSESKFSSPIASDDRAGALATVGSDSVGMDAAKLRREHELAMRQLKKQANTAAKAASKQVRIMSARAEAAEKSATNARAEQEALHKKTAELVARVSELEADSSELENLKTRAAQAENAEVARKDAERRRDELEKLYREEQVLRKRYWNMCEDMKGKIRVFARCRPMARYEVERGCRQAVSFADECTVTVDTGRLGLRTHVYDQCFAASSSQAEVFEDTSNLIRSALDGYNVCVFAYGQTGSGKTYTMIGENDAPGLVPRTIESIFSYRDENSDKVELSVRAYMVELYRDSLVDLLFKVQQGGKGTGTGKSRRGAAANAPKLDIKQDKKGMVTVRGAIVQTVESAEELLGLFAAANASRHTGSTKMNAGSSRSHLVLSLLLEHTDLTTRKTSVGKLSLVDLAGSERQDKTGATAERLKEAMSINKSLSALGDVISALSSGEKFIPYRNNKLTQLMSDSLGGNAKTLMFVNFSPADYNADETESSLVYASRVKLITNNADKSSESKELADLRRAVVELKASGGTSATLEKLEQERS